MKPGLILESSGTFRGEDGLIYPFVFMVGEPIVPRHLPVPRRRRRPLPVEG